METQVAQRIGLSKEQYKMVEEGTLRPSLSQFRILVKYLDLDLVTCRVLIGEEEERNVNRN